METIVGGLLVLLGIVLDRLYGYIQTNIRQRLDDPDRKLWDALRTE